MKNRFEEMIRVQAALLLALCTLGLTACQGVYQTTLDIAADPALMPMLQTMSNGVNNLPQIVSSKDVGALSVNETELPPIMTRVEFDATQRNNDDLQTIADRTNPIVPSISDETSTIGSGNDKILSLARIATGDARDLSSAAEQILANAEAPEVALALANSITGIAAANMMPQVWIQDGTTSEENTESLEPFSVEAQPMFIRGLEVDPVTTRTLEQSHQTERVALTSTLTDPTTFSTQDSAETFAFDVIDPEPCFINVQSGAGECADVVGGGVIGDILDNANCNTSLPTETWIENCPAPLSVTVPASSIRPPDEYICDGGDAGVHVRVNEDWTLRGLDLEDTVGHYDTLDGRTKVEPSNSVCIYAPRFANVRKVFGAFSDNQIIEPGNLLRPEVVGYDRQLESFVALDKREMANRDVQIGAALVFRERTRGISMNIRQRVAELENVQEVYQDFHVLQFGIFKRSEKARLAEFVDAADVWTEAVGPEVLINNTEALIDVVSQRPAIAYHVDDSGNPRLRIIKIASTKEALPGDEVEFTLRFDNVGDQTIGNVTIIDNLTARLEYIPDSAQCDVKANFVTNENEGGSLTLRWEIVEPLEAGEGGIATFKCKVR